MSKSQSIPSTAPPLMSGFATSVAMIAWTWGLIEISLSFASSISASSLVLPSWPSEIRVFPIVSSSTSRRMTLPEYLGASSKKSAQVVGRSETRSFR
jgi:hypothetical protein